MLKEYLKSKTAQSSLRLIVFLIVIFGLIPVILTQCATQIITAFQDKVEVFNPNWVAIGVLCTSIIALIPTQKKFTEKNDSKKE